MRWTRFLSILSVLMLFAACAGKQAEPESPEPGAIPAEEASAAAAELTRLEAEALNEFLEEKFDRDLRRSPQRQTYLGIKDDYGLWDDISDRTAREKRAEAVIALERLRKFRASRLDATARVSYRLAEYELEQEIAGYDWRFHSYPVNQMSGLHSQVPAFLLNYHRIDNEADALAYVERLWGVRPLFVQLTDNLRAREEKGILPPRFVFAKVIDDSRNVISGIPFDNQPRESTILSDFRTKVDALSELDEKRKGELVLQAKRALLESVKPAYAELIAFVEGQQRRAGTDDGAWKLPDGEAFYEFALRRTTTTALSATEIHEIGLGEVARIHTEMRAIMEKVGFEGNLPEFFEFMRKDAQFYYSSDAAGRQAYLARTDELIAGITARLDELFVTKPAQDLVVKPVEPYRERSAGKAFYNGAAPDGSRPGTYYVNLYDMADMPKYQMEALAYHEAIPGHHMQVAIAQKLEDLPRFRRFGGYSAYSEGWALYSELLPKELGFYEDPYSDFGRLAMELWRACRLVVDTGIHDRKWTREQAIAYLEKNTPNPKGDIVKAIERYIVWPGQATAYKIGMLKILELRKRAHDALGDSFSLPEFHDVVLTNGSVPLAVLEEIVDDWIDSKSIR